MADMDFSAVLDTFIQHIQFLSQDNSYHRLKSVLDENTTLRERNSILKITNDENHRTISKLQRRYDDSFRGWEEQVSQIATLSEDNILLSQKVALLELDAKRMAALTEDNVILQDKIACLVSDEERIRKQLSENTDRVVRLEAELAKKNKELNDTESELESTKTQLDNSRDECSNQQGNLNIRDSEIKCLRIHLDEVKSALAASQAAYEETTAELHSTREDLEAKGSRLFELNALSFKMKDPPQDQTRQQLHNMFTTTYRWAKELFSGDLEESVFITPASGVIWANIRNHGRVSRIIPLPLSNSRAAKHMRIAAVVAIIAWALAQYIFQPTYLLQCNELSDLMASLADDDPARENYLRSVLLPVLPSRQKAHGKRRINQAILDVLACLSPVLPENRQGKLRTSLETVCKQVCGQWMRLQLLDEKIEPSFDAYDDEDWNVLQLPSFDDSTNGYAEPTVAQACIVADEAGAIAESAIVDNERHDRVGDIEDIAAVLWPSFLSFRGGESELLTEGFVLNKEQLRTAYSEEKADLLQGIHRAARQIPRKDRTKSFATNPCMEEMSHLVKDFLPTDSDEPSSPESGDDGGAETNTEPDPDPDDEAAPKLGE